MRNFTADGKLKVHVEQAEVTSGTPTILASGTITTIPADPDGVALLQADYVTAATAGLAALQTPANGVSLSLTGAAASLIPKRLVTLTSAANLSGISFTVTGAEGSEIITGPNNTTVTGSTAFSTVTSIVPNGTSASTVSAGWPTSATIYPLVLIGALATPSRQLTLTSTSNFSAVSFTFLGTDTAGDALSEAIAGPNNSTVTTTGYFASLTSITPSALSAGNLSAGFPTTPAVLYEAPEDGATVSHFFIKNNNVVTQDVEVSLLVDGVLLPFRQFELEENESGSILQSEPNLPLPSGTQVRVDTTTTLALTYLLHGTET